MPLVNSQEYRFLVGGFKPENISQIGSFCQVGVQIKKKNETTTQGLYCVLMILMKTWNIRRQMMLKPNLRRGLWGSKYLLNMCLDV